MSKGPDEAISLFPFMSILACLIGTLTMMIAGLALQQASSSEKPVEPEVLARAERYAELNKQLEAQNKQLAELQAAIAAAEQSHNELMKSREDLAERLRQQQIADEARNVAATTATKLAAKIELEKKRAAEMEVELAELLKKMTPLQAELATRTAPPKEAEVVIKSTGSGIDIEAIFIECKAEGVVMLDEPETPFIRNPDLESDPRYIKAMDTVRSKSNGTLIFLMRNDGQGTYWHASDIARRTGTRNGKVPVVGQGKIDLGFFRKP